MSQIEAYELAKAEVGTWEWADGSNPRVGQYAIDAGLPELADDAIPWCATFVGAMLVRAGMKPTGSAGARSYLKWGEPVSLDRARVGDVVVLWRGSPTSWQGHVGFFEKREGDKVYLLGGNQRNQVNVSGYAANTVLGVRRAAQSATVAPQPKPAPTPAPEPAPPVVAVPEPAPVEKEGIEKAVAAFVTTALGMFAAAGFEVPSDVSEIATGVGASFITAAVVWYVRNSKKEA